MKTENPIQKNLYNTLKKHFGFDTFRPHQEDIIQSILNNNDVMGILPTGSGKSLCYQLPALLSEGVVIVVSPLIALMEDQVRQLDQLGIPAVSLNSTLDRDDQRIILSELGKYKLIYVSPERMGDPYWIQQMKSLSIPFFVIDESHCISQWGHAFRPDYRQLCFLKETFPTTPIMALTATATKDVQKDIKKALNIPNATEIIGSFDRPNLCLRIYPRDKGHIQVNQILKKHSNESGIIYAATRKKVDQLYDELSAEGVSVSKYHAGMSDQQRRHSQEQFINDDVQVIVATIAFGMGINKPDVRFVCHVNMPKNIEQYYQEIGRAGRDGLPSTCYLFFSLQDVIIQQQFNKDVMDTAVFHQNRLKTDRLLALCHSASCRRVELLAYFGETISHDTCENCDNCCDDIEWIDGTIIAQKIISGVVRLNQRFGIAYVVDVLVGSKQKKILQWGHDQLSTYGLLAEYDKKEIKQFIYALINQGYLWVTDDQFPMLKVTKKANPIKAISDIKFKQQKMNKTTKESISEWSADQALLTILKSFRKELATQRSVPPYMIFNDKTLIEVASKLPRTCEDLLNVYGIGKEKIKTFGDALCKVVNTYCDEQGIERTVKKTSILNHRVNSVKETTRSDKKEPSHEITFALYKKGLDIESIATTRQVTVETIETHFVELIEKNDDLDINQFVSKQTRFEIMNAVNELGNKQLRPIKDHCGESVSYRDIKWTLAFFRR